MLQSPFTHEPNTTSVEEERQKDEKGTYEACLSGRGWRNSRMNDPSNSVKGPAILGSSAESKRVGSELSGVAIVV